jgi:hypothetical protein
MGVLVEGEGALDGGELVFGLGELLLELVDAGGEEGLLVGEGFE